MLSALAVTGLISVLSKLFFGGNLYVLEVEDFSALKLRKRGSQGINNVDGTHLVLSSGKQALTSQIIVGEIVANHMVGTLNLQLSEGETRNLVEGKEGLTMPFSKLAVW